MVVSDSGVKGQYKVLDDAKKVLDEINSGNRFIAEVSSQGILHPDPHTINGQDQNVANGFNKSWCDYSCIYRLIDICKTYLRHGGKV